jgi:hypothetical protein
VTRMATEAYFAWLCTTSFNVVTLLYNASLKFS